MNCLWKLIFVVCVFSLSTSEISWSADPAPVVDNPNTATVATIDLTPATTRTTFKVTVTDPSQPVSLQVGATNAFEVVKSQLLSALKDQADLTEIVAVQSTTNKSGAPQPHIFRLFFSNNKSFELTINDGSFSIIPQYYVVASMAPTPTKISCDLLVINNSPNSLAGTKVSFLGGGITLPDDSVLNLKVGAEFPLPAKLALPSTSSPPAFVDHRELDKPLAYWANEADFGKKQTTTADLQLPMKGNWPKELTIPGWIHFSFDSQKLPDYTFTSPADFPIEISKEFHSFKGTPLPKQYDPVTLTAKIQNAISSIDKWPQVDFDSFTDFSSGDQSAKPVWLRMNDTTNSNLTYNPTGMPKNPVKSIVVQKSANLVIYPGEETAIALATRSAFMGELVTRQRGEPADVQVETKRKAMLAELKPLVDSLKLIQPIVVEEEKRIKYLNDSLTNLDTKEEVAVKNRVKLSQAQKSLAALIDSYNAWVMAHPK